jgi:uncharacterized membrane protein
METILRFFSETLIMEWLWGNEIIDLFNQYFLNQSDSNKVLLIMGVTILSILGSIQVVKMVLKMTLTWVKIILFVALSYYLFVVILGVDIWALFGF